MAELTHAQLDVAAAFFALHESEGFVVVGGAALITLELVDRLTEDLDFFVSIPGRVTLHPRRCVQPWNFEVGRWPSFVTPSRFNDSKLLAMNELVRVDLRSIQLHAYQ